MLRYFVLVWTLLLLPSSCLAQDQLELCSVSAHSMRYYLSQPSRELNRSPILIAFAGCDVDFLGHAQRFLAARKDRSVVLVVPCTFSSANFIFAGTYDRFREVYDDELIHDEGGFFPNVRSRLAWDEQGLLALIDDLRQRGLGGDIHLTGFSAGGMLAWWMALKHPELFTSVRPVCSSFPIGLVGRADCSESLARQALRIHAITGEKDPLRPSRVGLPMPPIGVTAACLMPMTIGAWYARRRGWRRRRVAALTIAGVIVTVGLIVGRCSGIEMQTCYAVELLRELGYTRVERVIQAGMYHEPAAELVLDQVVARRAP